MAADIEAMRKQFAGVKFLSFDAVNGLVRVHVKTPAATARVFLQGAHLTAWQPTGEAPVIFLSRKTELVPGKPLRGGVPVAWPWFATDRKQDRVDGHPGPSHGFARTEEWTLETASEKDGSAELTFALGPTETSRRMGFDHFALTVKLAIGSTLTESLTVRNLGGEPLRFEEAFHTYYQVADVHEATVSGLEQVGYLDKTNAAKATPASGEPVSFSGTVDRVYLDTAGPYRLRDGAGRRTILVEKRHSQSTIVWNMFHEMPALGEWDWHEYVAVEVANVDRDAITLLPGAEHVMGMRVSVKRDSV